MNEDAIRETLKVIDEKRKRVMMSEDLPFRCRKCGAFVGQERLYEADDYGPAACKRCVQSLDRSLIQ